MGNASLVKERKMVAQIPGPVQQVIVIVRSELCQRPIGREEAFFRKTRTPLIPWVAIQMNDLCSMKILAEPRKTKIDTVELEHGPALGFLEQHFDVALQERLPMIGTHQ